MKPAILSTLSLIMVLILSACTTTPESASTPTTAPTTEPPFVATLFSGAEQYENFNRVAELLPTSKLTASIAPYQFADGTQIDLPKSFSYNGENVQTSSFLAETDTAAMLILKDGKVIYEQYSLTGGRNVNWLSMSVSKSFISALIGIAVHEGDIASIEDPVTKYTPSLLGSAYDNVRIKDILQMSSGAKWNEDYSDPESDIGRLAAVLATGGSLNEFSATLSRDNEPGTNNLYNSTDTQVLGYLLTEATGRTITDYMQEKLWEPLGMESPAYWIVDGTGMEMAFGGLNVTARDYAKLGQLYLNGGKWGDQQLVPQSWVSASIVPDAPHLEVGANDFGMGYGYQWWLMDGDQGEYSAIGVYNQFIYVNPVSNVVIVKLSANSDYGLTNEESSYREIETIAFFRSILAQ